MPTNPLQHFIGNHPFNRVTVDGVCWEYIACGQGEETIVLLPGAPGRAETSYVYIAAFEKAYRVITISYPAGIATVDDCLNGLNAVMAAEGVERAYVVGGSYSGLLAQSWVRRSPDLVSGLVLCNTGVPSPTRARKYALWLRLLPVTPMLVVRLLWWWGAHLYLRGVSGPSTRLWVNYFAYLGATVTRREIASRLKVWVDFDRNSAFSANDLDGWPGKILIISAGDDLTFPAWERAALCAFYPTAHLQTLPHGGHASSIDRSEDYVAAIGTFLVGLRSEATLGVRANELC